jgi:hypothetical protein
MTLDCLFCLSAERSRLKSGAGTLTLGSNTSKGFLNLLIALHDFELIAVVSSALSAGRDVLGGIAFKALESCALLLIGMPQLGQLDAVVPRQG